MTAARLVSLLLVAAWPLAVPAQLVVREDERPTVANPADRVPYPSGARSCNDTIADAGARAVLRAIDRCPQEFIDSRDSYLGYARQAVLGLLVPGASEAAGLLILDKAKENALFCISDALIDESGAGDADRAFLKALVAEAKEQSDRNELVAKIGELGTALRERAYNPYFTRGDASTFVNTLDVQYSERAEALEAESTLLGAGRARYDTPETRARDLTEQARTLARECRYAEAEAGLARAQQANLAYLAQLRSRVESAKHHLFCIERDARQRPVNALDPAIPYVAHSLAGAGRDLEAARLRDAEQTALIGQLAQLQESMRLRRNDVDVLKQRAGRHLEAARRAIVGCDYAGAAGALDALNRETLDCALQLDAERRAGDEALRQLEERKAEVAGYESEYAKVIAKPFAAVAGCGELSVVADGFDQLGGACRAIVGVDAKVAALRRRARECADAKTAAKTGGTLTGKVELAEDKREDHGGGSYTRSTYGPSRHTWERVDRGYPFQVVIAWNYRNVPSFLEPGKQYTITVDGGVESESAKGVADGFVLAGVVAVYGDVSGSTGQQADRGHPVGTYVFTVNPNAQNVEIHLGGAPMGTGAIWKYTRVP